MADYITPPFLNIGPFRDPCPAHARPCAPLPDSVGYDFNPKIHFLNQDFPWTAQRNLDAARVLFTSGTLSNIIETEINLSNEVRII